MNASATVAPELRRIIEVLLSARYGMPLRVTGVEGFRPHQVSRCTLAPVAGDAPDVPPTVIVRVLRSDPARSDPARLLNEQAALEFLAAIGSAVAPRFIVGDAAAGVLVSEDLGSHPSLLDVLLGSDGAAAREGLIAFARALGRLHADTAGRAVDYQARRVALGPTAAVASADPEAGASVVHSWQGVRAAVDQLGLPPPYGVDDDVEAVAAALAAPGDYLALSSGDPSVVNCKVVGGRVRLFDFESAGFRHALIDATVLRYPYPTGGPVWRLPREVGDAAERAYRDELELACPGARDTPGYERALAAACAAWTILRLVRLQRVEAGPDREPWRLLPPGWAAPVPERSRRRQLVSIIETCVASARHAGTLDRLAAWCVRVAGSLRTRWPEAIEEDPLYPALTT